MPKLTAIRKQALDEMMKEALFEATVAVLSEHGVDGMTMDRVAEAAGVAKGSLYRYFRSKRDLLELVFTKMVDPVFQATEAIAATDQTAIEKLATQLRTLLQHVAKHVHVHKLLFEDDAARGLLNSSERRTFEAASQQLSDVFRQGIAEGVFRPADPLTLAKMYLGLCKGALRGQCGVEGRDQVESLHGLILGAFLNGIATEKARVG